MLPDGCLLLLEESSSTMAVTTMRGSEGLVLVLGSNRACRSFEEWGRGDALKANSGSSKMLFMVVGTLMPMYPPKRLTGLGSSGLNLVSP